MTTGGAIISKVLLARVEHSLERGVVGTPLRQFVRTHRPDLHLEIVLVALWRNSVRGYGGERGIRIHHLHGNKGVLRRTSAF